MSAVDCSVKFRKKKKKRRKKKKAKVTCRAGETENFKVAGAMRSRG